tara:strand:+ start:575 stop:925 length:351 start_codon:yes stop_codon:yes gene_type:complete
MKKQFKVTTIHTVYIDSYNEGEGNYVNSFDIESTQKTETIREAIENHFNNTIYLPFNFEHAETNEDNKVMYWSNLVDEDNNEPSKYDIEKWKKEEKELYSNNIEIIISEIVPLKFD